MFSTLKQYLKFRITHLIYTIATTKYEARTWTRTITCPNCQRLIPIDAHFCLYCGHHMTISPSIEERAEQEPSPSPPDAVTSESDIELQDTEPISLGKIHTLLSPEYPTRRFLAYVRTYNGQQISQTAMLHRQRQDTETITRIIYETLETST
jgi:hypothetical protein